MLRRIANWFRKPKPVPATNFAPGYKVRLYGLGDKGSGAKPEPLGDWVCDLADPTQVRDLMRGFGNLCFVEVRAVGESTRAIERFRQLVACCGFRQGSDPRSGSSWLFHAGDEAYPEGFPFVFICPTPDPSLTDEGLPPRPTAYEPNFEVFLQRWRNPDLSSRG